MLTAIKRKTILDNALLAPSGDNSQPWAFSWTENSLTIIHDSSRSEHPLNPKNLSSGLMLGCLLEALEIAASNESFATTLQLLDLSAGGTTPWARVHFETTDKHSDPLFNYLKIRSTDRREYQKGHLSLDLFSEILAAEIKYAPAQLHIIDGVTENLKNYIIDAEQNLISHPDILPSVMKWTRYTLSGARRSGDGITWRNMLAKLWEVPFMYLVPRFGPLLNLLRPAMARQHRRRTSKQIESSAGLICISSQKTGHYLENAVQAGRLMMRVWLRLTQLGFGVQPISLSTLPIFYGHENVLDYFFATQSQFYKDGEVTLKKMFGIPQKNFPIWMIRTGKSTPLPVQLRTFRKPANENP